MSSSGHSLQIRNFAYCLFVMPIFPFATVLYIFQAVEMYWVVKWMIVRNSNKVIRFSSRLSRKLVDEFILCILLFILGCMLRDTVSNYIQLKSFRIRPLHIGLLIGVYCLFVTKVKNLFWMWVPKKQNSPLGYMQTLRKEPHSYVLANPAYQGMDKFSQEYQFD
jgi:hypothetical protein